ncbi:MAG: glycerol acyltransferase [Bacteroidales bacterium]|nr:glycerol acyltransferase [Bacteroidales bacterium]
MESPNIDIKYIDIAKIIKDSNSSILKKLPRLVIKWVAKIIKQDEMNRILNKYSEHTGVSFLPQIIKEFNLTLQIEGTENLPDSGKCFFAANHPFGVIDGLIITHIVSSKYGILKAIGNDAFMFLPQLRPLIAAVNVYGQSSKEYVKALDAVYNSDIPITHFPAGEVSRKYNGKIQDNKWQKSFITKSISSERDIVPLHFFGRNSRLFYFINRMRQIFGIKINIELLLLPREMFRKRNETIRVVIGKPISHKTFTEKSTHAEWAQKVRSQVYNLGDRKSNNNI